MDFIDNIRYVRWDGDSVGPGVQYMISFVAGCRELCRKPKGLSMFHLSCFCSQQIVLDLPEVSFRWDWRRVRFI